MKDKDVAIWLNSIEGINNKTIDKLEKYLGKLSYVWDLSRNDILKINCVNDKAKNLIIKYKNMGYYNEYLEKVHKLNINIISIYDDEYPKLLKNIYSPPKILYIKGSINEEDYNAISIVGSRKATSYGHWAAEKFSKELSRAGVTVVSGMAKGIDTTVHKGAIEGNGRTIAVLGSGIDVIYPKSNRRLYNEIIDSGGVISEFPIGTIPRPYNFPQRNRIISGLTLGVIVVEATEKSGSLITAEHALEQGRDVFALPGNINSLYSKGTNKLIKDGAYPIVDIDDIFEEIIELRKKVKENEIIRANYQYLSIEEKNILKLISENPKHCDIISYRTGINIQKVNSILTILEMKGLVKQLPGKFFTVC
ncbi:DNA-processing protein DprA [Dethiothermospora halolimnae]|uniref:DNA-processing protein DprA n=1 Tax=Dethiothermospora halolimnae TaxID=3114390 RepID=UPI003CCC25D5